MSGTVLVLGGRSEIGLAVAVRLARKGHRDFVLAARRCADLNTEEAALREAGAANVARVEFDADEVGEHATFLADITKQHGPLDVVVTAFGILGDQQRAETDTAHALSIVHTDYVAHVSILSELATMLREQGSVTTDPLTGAHPRRGTLIVFSSVAGVRVRRANYVYGSAKAGLDGFASGLADALDGTGVHLLLVRPGFVIGRMTDGMSPAPLSSTPDQVADATVAAFVKGKGEVWVPGTLRLVFAAFRLLPRAIWRKMPR
ncbi:MAG TPA: SDR family NAD(P)-dependent oxidoreductase [Pseudonocardiaceae bacterium]